MGSPTANRAFRNSTKMRKAGRASRVSGKNKGTSCQKYRNSIIFCMARAYKRKDYASILEWMEYNKWR